MVLVSKKVAEKIQTQPKELTLKSKRVSSSFNANLGKLLNIIQQSTKNTVNNVSNIENNNKGLLFYIDKKEQFNNLTAEQIDTVINFFIEKTAPNIANKENVYKVFLDEFNNYKRLSNVMAKPIMTPKSKAVASSDEMVKPMLTVKSKAVASSDEMVQPMAKAQKEMVVSSKKVGAKRQTLGKGRDLTQPEAAVMMDESGAITANLMPIKKGRPKKKKDA
jgi:hypothetical protein